MNKYIQDKLDEIEEKTKHLDGLVDKPLLMILVKEALTDYHNHIVEKIKNAPNDMVINDKKYNNPREYTLAILQDTNPKE